MISSVTTSFDFVLEFLGEPEIKLISNLISKLTDVDTSALKTNFKFWKLITPNKMDTQDSILDNAPEPDQSPTAIPIYEKKRQSRTQTNFMRSYVTHRT